MKKIFIIFTLVLLLPNLFAKTLNNTQCIQEGSWVYDALYQLGTESQISGLYDTVPLTVGEIKFHFAEIDYDSLSESGKYLYYQLRDFLFNDSNILSKYNIDEFRLSLGVKVNPELMYKSNPEIDWSYNYCFRDRLLTVPIILGFFDYVTIQLDPFLGKNYAAMKTYWNFTNIPLSFLDFEFHMPDYAIGSTGIYFDKFGADLKVGRKGLTIGNTRTGSIIFNNTFETDCYVQLNVFNHFAKYTMDVVQVDYTKFLYLHQISVRLFKKLEVEMIEGSLINSSFELRYLNPLMIMHSFASWTDYGAYSDPNIMNWYGESNFCAYLGFLLNYTPIKNVRFYGMFAQNELQTPNEHPFNPDSLGIQVGADVSVPAFDNGFWRINTELVYTSPFFYIKQAPQWSLYRVRNDNQNRTAGPIKSWLGTPFGPDCFALQCSFGYQKMNKWEADFGYLLTIHGENNFSIFDCEPDENGIYHYYPYTHYYESLLNGSVDDYVNAYNESRNMMMSGVQEIKNQFVLKGNYYILSNFYFTGQMIYTFVCNNKNIAGNFQHGIELSLAVTYKLF